MSSLLEYFILISVSCSFIFLLLNLEEQCILTSFSLGEQALFFSRSKVSFRPKLMYVQAGWDLGRLIHTLK